jgi:hypothetical protein
MRSWTLAALALLAFAAPSFAQDSVYYPGSLYTTNGTLSPVEKNNIVSFSHIEQGIAYRGAELFGAFTGQVDSKGYPWNRRTVSSIGLRFTQNIASGSVRVSAGYTRENQFAGPNTVVTGPFVAVDAWFGWRQARR